MLLNIVTYILVIISFNLFLITLYINLIRSPCIEATKFPLSLEDFNYYFLKIQTYNN